MFGRGYVADYIFSTLETLLAWTFSKFYKSRHDAQTGKLAPDTGSFLTSVCVCCNNLHTHPSFLSELMQPLITGTSKPGASHSHDSADSNSHSSDLQRRECHVSEPSRTLQPSMHPSQKFWCSRVLLPLSHPLRTLGCGKGWKPLAK